MGRAEVLEERGWARTVADSVALPDLHKDGPVHAQVVFGVILARLTIVGEQEKRTRRARRSFIFCPHNLSLELHVAENKAGMIHEKETWWAFAGRSIPWILFYRNVAHTMV